MKRTLENATLYSKHVDIKPGDRACPCQGLMKPIDLVYTGMEGYQLVHECLLCGKQQNNKVAVDTEQEDHILSFFHP